LARQPRKWTTTSAHVDIPGPVSVAIRRSPGTRQDQAPVRRYQESTEAVCATPSKLRVQLSGRGSELASHFQFVDVRNAPTPPLPMRITKRTVRVPDHRSRVARL
jgi:hypothetical protein